LTQPKYGPHSLLAASSLCFIYYREQVRLLLGLLLGLLDPVGVAIRKKRRLNRRVYSSKVIITDSKNEIGDYFIQGPKYCWHIDGNDKLVPYGFAIHGGIDG